MNPAIAVVIMILCVMLVFGLGIYFIESQKTLVCWDTDKGKACQWMRVEK